MLVFSFGGEIKLYNFSQTEFELLNFVLLFNTVLLYHIYNIISNNNLNSLIIDRILMHVFGVSPYPEFPAITLIIKLLLLCRGV